MKYSCIIPAYNEGLQLLDVLEIVSKIRNISQVICSIDGKKNEKLVQLIKDKYPLVILDVSLSKRGKTGAVARSLDMAKNENIILLDADLIGLKAHEVEKALRIFESEGLDCLLLHTRAMNFGYYLSRKLFRATLCVDGNRITKKNLIVSALKRKKAKDYQLEIAQNLYLLENNKKSAYFRVSAIDLGKTAKVGSIKGMLKEADMWRQIIYYAGWTPFLRQALLFARKEVKA